MEIVLKLRTLNELSLDKYTLDIAKSPGDTVGNIIGRTPGSEITIVPETDQIAILGDKVVVGTGEQVYEEFLEVALVETLDGYRNSPRSTLITIERSTTVAVDGPLTIEVGQVIFPLKLEFEGETYLLSLPDVEIVE